jgi:hypothetical protein
MIATDFTDATLTRQAAVRTRKVRLLPRYFPTAGMPPVRQFKSVKTVRTIDAYHLCVEQMVERTFRATVTSYVFPW